MRAVFGTPPVWVIMIALMSVLMFLPAAYGAGLNDWNIARSFFYHGVFFLLVSAVIALALAARKPLSNQGTRLLALFATYLIVPFVLALPFAFLIPNLDFFDAYVEMLSALTTTGASLIDSPLALSDVLHFWRALVAWAGGCFILVIALAVFLPMNIGGFETYAVYREWADTHNESRRIALHDRIWVYTCRIAPVYMILTVSLAIIFILLGDRPVLASIHAMSIISTSGITTGVEFHKTSSGVYGELVAFMFLLFAVSRFMYQPDTEGRAFRKLIHDKENNIAIFGVIGVAVVLFMAHFGAATTTQSQDSLFAGLKALWGAIFTLLSFLTTTGFESAHWTGAQNWSGLNTTGLILMGFALAGGGIATTAGGIKLLRIYALYKNGLRELQKLNFPNSVLGRGDRARSIRTEGAYAAWVFFMLFMLSVAFACLLYAMLGLTVEDALLLSIAGLSTTGPLVPVVSETGLNYSDLKTLEKLVFCATMILGRLELLAVIAILNPRNFTITA